MNSELMNQAIEIESRLEKRVKINRAVIKSVRYQKSDHSFYLVNLLF